MLTARAVLAGAGAVAALAAGPAAFAQGAEDPLAPLDALDRASRALLERVRPAVVRVSAERTLPLRLRNASGEDLQRLARLLAQTARETVTATGFLVDSPDLVVTVADAADRRCEVIRVTFPGGETRDARFVGSDATTGLALLRIRPVPGARPVELAPGEPRPGALCFLLGYADDEAPSLELGFVTATHRPVGAYDAYVLASVGFRPGDAGAPLLDSRGRVAGLAVAPRAEPGHGGLLPSPDLAATQAPWSPTTLPTDRGEPARCVPAAEIRRVVDALRDQGRVPRGLCGVHLHEREALVTRVEPGLPAEAAGVREGDRVLSVDGIAVETRRQFVGFIQRRAPGTRAALALRGADGVERTVVVTLAAFPEEPALPPGWFDGLGVVDREGGGVEVSSVHPGSSAAVAGVEPGDVLVSVAGRPVASVAGYQGVATSDLSTAREVVLVLRRGGATIEVVLK